MGVETISARFQSIVNNRTSSCTSGKLECTCWRCFSVTVGVTCVNPSFTSEIIHVCAAQLKCAGEQRHGGFGLPDSVMT